jgi:DNA-binding IclR family transcriptional regulator
MIRFICDPFSGSYWTGYLSKDGSAQKSKIFLDKKDKNLVYENLHILEIKCQNMTINQSLAHGLNVLLLFNVSTPLLTVSEISKRLKYSQSKTYRLVRTLIQYGLIQEDGEAAKYSLGLNALRVGFLAQKRFDISIIASPFMKQLCALTKETVFLTAINGTKGICIAKEESEEPIRWHAFQLGQEIPMHCSAPGKVLMAYLPEEDWDRIIVKEGLKRYTPNTITNIDELKAQLREIKKEGYALSDKELYEEVRAVSAPILNASGEVIAALSIAGPVYRIGKRKLLSLGKLNIQYAQKISNQLGYKTNTDKGAGSKKFTSNK